MKQKSFSFTISAISIFTLSLTSCSSSNLLYEAKEVAQFTYNDGFINYLNNVSLFSSDFSETLYQNYKNGDNIVYSPISVYLCLGVAAEISQNNTREEILNALNTNYNDLNKNYHILFESLHPVWIPTDFQISQDFRHISFLNIFPQYSRNYHRVLLYISRPYLFEEPVFLHFR